LERRPSAGSGSSTTAPAISLTQAANLAVANGAPTIVTWGTVVLNRGSIYDAGQPTKLIIAPSDGLYFFDVEILWEPNAVGERMCYYRLNGAGTNHYFSINSGAALTNGNWCGGGVAVSLTAADYIEVGVYQDSGGAVNVVGGAGQFVTLGCAWKVL